MISAGITTAVIFYITIDQRLSEAVVGAVLSGFALGSLLGSVAAARLAFRATGVVMLVGRRRVRRLPARHRRAACRSSR